MRVGKAIGWGLAFAVFVYLGNDCSRPQGPDIYTAEGKAELMARGDEIRAGIERYRAREGRYPRALRQIDVPLSWDDRAYGGWEYRTQDGGKNYYLGVGGYARYGFVLYRTSGSVDWLWDT